MTSMPTLNIRNLSEAVHRRLRIRAAQAGRSMEAEARAILTAACSEGRSKWAPADLQAWVVELYGGAKPRRVVDALIRERRREASRE